MGLTTTERSPSPYSDGDLEELLKSLADDGSGKGSSPKRQRLYSAAASGEPAKPTAGQSAFDPHAASQPGTILNSPGLYAAALRTFNPPAAALRTFNLPAAALRTFNLPAAALPAFDPLHSFASHAAAQSAIDPRTVPDSSASGVKRNAQTTETNRLRQQRFRAKRKHEAIDMQTTIDTLKTSLTISESKNNAFNGQINALKFENSLLQTQNLRFADMLVKQDQKIVDLQNTVSLLQQQLSAARPFAAHDPTGSQTR